MKLQALQMKNIRSYKEETVRFTEGMTLFSGDIGSGKSTILLSIEFALFGIMRGTLSGSELLRHGAGEGSVDLEFKVNNKNVKVRRRLKKTSRGVQQGTGHIVIDGKKVDGTATELKSRILNLLNYPSSLVSKGKSLIYRYTVYTPQEDLKRIIFEDAESRIDTLRKIFRIDKYKKASENSKTYSREVRKEISRLEGKTEDIEELKEEKKKKKERIEEIKEEYESIKKRIESVEEVVEELDENLKEYRKLKFKKESLQKKRENLKREIKEVKNRIKKNKEEQEDLKKKVSKTEEKLKKQKLSKEDIKKRKTKIEKNLNSVEKIISKKHSKKGDIQGKIKRSKKLIEKISDLDKCPKCKQKVGETHKERIEEEEGEKIEKWKEKLEEINKAIEKSRKKKEGLKEQKKEVESRKQELKINREKKKNLQEKKKKIKSIEEAKEELEEKIEEKKEELSETTKKLSDLKDIPEEEFKKKEKTLKKKRNSLKKLNSREASKKKEKELEKKNLKKIKKKIKEKEDLKKELKTKRKMETWISKQFQKTADLIEKQVMMSIYQEFNNYFKKWFNMLIEEDNMSVKLDERFEPVVQQDGYKTSTKNLSGGEKTSIALAYRLSMNKVINDYVGEINTKDILILDEPTDGFSNDQLDNVRDVLKELHLNQIIIVSHEQKMESYVDDIVHVVKEQHKSRVEEVS